MQFQPFLKEDLVFLSDLRPEDWTDLTPPFLFYTDSSFCYPIKISDQNKILGIGCCILHHDVAWLGHIVVHPLARKQGLGYAITQQLIEIAHEKGASTIQLIATDMGAPVYEKCGFITETEYLFYKDLSPPPSSGSIENIIPFKKEYYHALLDFDQTLSAENRKMHLQDFLTSGFLWMKGKELKGVYLPAFGEGLILAKEAEAGLDLLRFHLQEKQTLVFPEENKTAYEWLQEQQYSFFRKAKRMRRGESRNWSRSDLFNRIGGNLG